MKRFIGLALLFALVLTACAGNADPRSGKDGAGQGEIAAEPVVETEAMDQEVAQEEAMEAPAGAESDAARSAGTQQGDDGAATVAAWDRKIIKNATVKLEAKDVLNVQQRITALSNQFDGYVVESRTWYDSEDRPHALYRFAVPVDSFEEALGAVRDQGKVLDEQTSGKDVTDQYVDLEARIKNLEATATRIRSFLDDARTVEEALRVNQQLAQVEEQLERLKGQRNALEQRAAFSTITVEIAPPALDGVITQNQPDEAWSPSETFAEATEVLMALVRRVVDAGIWVAVVGLPIVAVVGAVALIGRRLLPSRPPVQT